MQLSLLDVLYSLHCPYYILIIFILLQKWHVSQAWSVSLSRFWLHISCCLACTLKKRHCVLQGFSDAPSPFTSLGNNRIASLATTWFYILFFPFKPVDNLWDLCLSLKFGWSLPAGKVMWVRTEEGRQPNLYNIYMRGQIKCIQEMLKNKEVRFFEEGGWRFCVWSSH